ncbi:MAG: hypothetical protein HY200_09090 [Nitrospirae bacterium]|nr:hypothetical protein [Nitrospirota bacterium]
MSSRIVLTLLILLSVILTSIPAHSTRLYSWKDDQGMLTLSDDPTFAPKGVHVEIASDYPDLHVANEIDLTVTEAMTPDHTSQKVSQGEFALQLVKELGFGQISAEKKAGTLLNTFRISPPLGQWKLNQVMTLELTVRLRKLTEAAATAKRIPLTSEEVLIAFDTAAALLNLNVPGGSPREKILSPSVPVPLESPTVPAEPSLPGNHPASAVIPTVEVYPSNNYFYTTYFVPSPRTGSFENHPHHSGGIDSGHRDDHIPSPKDNQTISPSPFISPLGSLISPVGRVTDSFLAIK